MSVSLIAVFVPILLMGGLVGRLFREFAMTITIAIVISLVVSLTTTPMMCAVLLRGGARRPHGWIYRASEAVFEARVGRLPADARRRAASSAPGDAGPACATLGLNFYLYASCRRASSRSRIPDYWSVRSRPIKISRFN